MNSFGGDPREGAAGEKVYGQISYADANSPYRVQPPKPQPPEPAKIVTPIRIAIVLVGLFAVFIYEWRNGAFIPGRDIRQTALVEVAPLQIDDTTSPLAGPEGTDANGYPTQYVDPEILRAMLARKRYSDLTKYFEQFQDAFEKDARHEYWIIDAGEAFQSAEPALKDQLDAWVLASPDSFAPYLARGSHWEGVGFARRGTGYAAQTGILDIKGMHDAFNLAAQDLAKAILLRPKLVAAKRYQIKIESAGGARAKIRQILDDSLIDCPTCFQIRAVYIYNTRPRWGGDYAEMNAVASAAPVSKNPKLRLLAGFVDQDLADIALSKKDFSGALTSINRACALGDFADFLAERALIHDSAGDPKAALDDINRALALRPKIADNLAERSDLQRRNEDYEGAARSLLDALRIDPTNSRARGEYEMATGNLIYLIDRAHKAGNDKDALRLADLGADLAPSNLKIQQWRTWILSGGDAGPAAGASAAAAARASGTVPDDIDQVRQMDYSLARENKYTEILPLWDAYIAKHPNDGRAYLERGGTHLHLGQNDLAGQDALKACDLGVNEGCMRAHQLGL
jgi:tetratricopeptide (TPR) repeat protein